MIARNSQQHLQGNLRAILQPERHSSPAQGDGVGIQISLQHRHTHANTHSHTRSEFMLCCFPSLYQLFRQLNPHICLCFPHVSSRESSWRTFCKTRSLQALCREIPVKTRSCCVISLHAGLMLKHPLQNRPCEVTQLCVICGCVILHSATRVCRCDKQRL